MCLGLHVFFLTGFIFSSRVCWAKPVQELFSEIAFQKLVWDLSWDLRNRLPNLQTDTKFQLMFGTKKSSNPTYIVNMLPTFLRHAWPWVGSHHPIRQYSKSTSQNSFALKWGSTQEGSVMFGSTPVARLKCLPGFEKTLSEEYGKTFLPSWSLLVQSQSLQKGISLHSRLVSATIDGCLVTSRVVLAILGVQTPNSYSPCLAQANSDMTLSPANLTPTRCCDLKNFVES